MKYFIFILYIFLINSICLAQTIITIAGNGTAGFSGDGGPATSAEFNTLGDLALDKTGNIYVTDGVNFRIRKINTAGIISTFAGSGTARYCGDGGPATAACLSPVAVACDTAGNVYISSVTAVRVVNTSGVISTFAGGATGGYSGDGGPATAAELGDPVGLYADTHGNIFICDELNFRIRKVAASGIITTIAGTGHSGTGRGFSGDGGPATAALLDDAISVVGDSTGNVYFADGGNSRIRKIDTAGIINTIAGTGTGGYSGDGGPATAANITLWWLAIDRCGNLLAADAVNSVIRKINTSGIITTIAGTGSGGFSGDGGPATAAQLYRPGGIAVDCVGNIYVSDDSNFRVREILYPNSRPYFTGGERQALNICSATGPVNIDTVMAIIDSDCGQTETWSLLSAPVHGSLVSAYTATSNTGTIVPTGLTYTPATGYSGLDSFSVIITDCGGLSDTAKVIVTLGAPFAAGAIEGAGSVCAGAGISLTDTTTGGLWSSGAPGIATVSAGGIVTGITTGSTTISYAVTNSCGTATATQAITVNPLPDAGTISGASSVCTGTSSTLTETVSGGTWSSGTTGVATINSSGAVSGVAAGTTIISYSFTNSCGTAVATDTITVNISPVAGTIAGATIVCEEATISLTDTAGGGVWSSGATGTATVTAGGLVTGVAAGSANITYTVTNSCGTATTTQAITVNPLPDAGSITGAGSLCAGASISLTESAGGGSWSSGSAGIATVDGSGNVTGVAAGTAAISYSITNSCGTTYAVDDITVNAIPSAGTITGARHLCVGNTALLTDAVSSGVWSSAATAIASISPAGEVAGVATGMAIISYSVSGTCGTGYAFDTLTVTPYITGTITGADNVCTGATITLTDTAGGGAWISGSAYVATISGTGTVTGVNAGVVIITYSYTNSCGAVSVYHTITVDGYLDPGTVSGPAHACVGSPVTLTASASSPDWRTTNGNATVSSTGVVTGIATGIDTIVHIFSNSCGLSSATFIDTIDERVSFDALGTMDTICEGDTLVLARPVPGGYFFSSNSSVTITEGGKITAETPGYDTITYAVINGCGSSEAVLTLVIQPNWLCELGTLSVLTPAGWQVFPNPATDILTITNPGAPTAAANYIIVNILGETLLQGSLTSGSNSIDLSSLPAGNYILQLHRSDGAGENALFVKE